MTIGQAVGQAGLADAPVAAAGPEAGDLTLEEADIVAKGFGLDSTKKLLFDLSEKSQAADIARIEDAVFATLRYPSGVLVNLHASWLNPRKSREIDLRVKEVGSYRTINQARLAAGWITEEDLAREAAEGLRVLGTVALAFSPATVSERVLASEAVVLGIGLVVILATNALLLRRWRPITQ